MTVQTNTNSIAYVGNGSTVHFDYDFLILDASHLKVYFGDVLQTSGYVVSGVLSQTGGTVAFAVAPPSGTDITFTRDVPFLQLTDYQPYDAFPAESHERALDLLTMMAQQLKDASDRSMQYPVGGNKWDAKGNEIINVGTGNSGTSAPNIDQVKYLIASEVGNDPSASASVRSREALRRSYAEAGYNLVDGSFEVGGTLVNANDVLLQERTGKAFSGPAGTVAAGTNPASGGFVDKSGGLLRHELATSFAPNDKIYLANYSHLAVGTDWTSAILAALNDVPITGAEIVLPAGSFEHGAITISKRVKITGQGTHAVAGNSPSQLVKKSTVSGSGIKVEAAGCHFEGFALKGADGNAGDGLEILNGRFSATDFAVYSMGRDGIRIGNDNPIYNTNGFCLTNIKSKGNGRHGLHVSDKVAPTLPDASGGSVFFADLQDNRECGLYLGNCFVNTFTGLLVQKNGTYGVRCTPSSSYNYFYGGDYEVNGRPAGVAETSYLDFWIEAGSKYNKIIGGNCYNFPISFQCDEPENLIIGMNDGVFAGDNKYAGIQLMNKESPIPTFLDYYKEGDFTPVVIGRTSAGTATYTTQVGKFTRIGNVVNFTINVDYSGHTGTGNMAIIGLPFTSKSDTSTAVSVYSFGLAKPLNSYITALVVGGDAGVTLYSAQSDSIAATGVAIPIDPAASVNVSGFYFV